MIHIMMFQELIFHSHIERKSIHEKCFSLTYFNSIIDFLDKQFAQTRIQLCEKSLRKNLHLQNTDLKKLQNSVQLFMNPQNIFHNLIFDLNT